MGSFDSTSGKERKHWMEDESQMINVYHAIKIVLYIFVLKFEVTFFILILMRIIIN